MTISQVLYMTLSTLYSSSVETYDLMMAH